jgi:hypothetical protein
MGIIEVSHPILNNKIILTENINLLPMYKPAFLSSAFHGGE